MLKRISIESKVRLNIYDVLGNKLASSLNTI